LHPAQGLQRLDDGIEAPLRHQLSQLRLQALEAVDHIARVPYGTVTIRMKRDGFQSDRLLIDVKVSDLAALLKTYPLGDPGVEHVFDY